MRLALDGLGERLDGLSLSVKGLGLGLNELERVSSMMNSKVYRYHVKVVETFPYQRYFATELFNSSRLCLDILLKRGLTSIHYCYA